MTQFSNPKETWDARYSGADGFLFGEAPNRWLQGNASALKPGARVLCVADGEGRNGVWLAQRGCQVTSFDISSVGVDKARQHAAGAGVDLDIRQADAAQWEWQEQAYDAVVAIFIQFASPSLRSKIFQGIRKTLVPGGILILEGYGPRQMVFRTGGPGVEQNLYTTPMVAQCFSGWQVLASRDLNCEVQEGAGHSGMSHLVSVVMQKPEDLPT